MHGRYALYPRTRSSSLEEQSYSTLGEGESGSVPRNVFGFITVHAGEQECGSRLSNLLKYIGLETPATSCRFPLRLVSSSSHLSSKRRV
jgi:hypothetical protein